MLTTFVRSVLRTFSVHTLTSTRYLVKGQHWKAPVTCATTLHSSVTVGSSDRVTKDQGYKTVMHQLSIFVVAGFLLVYSQWILASPINSSTSASTNLNVWQETSEWQCNTPLVRDGLKLSLLQYPNEDKPEEKFLLLYGGLMSTVKVSDETWIFSLQSTAWSRLPAQTSTERPSGRKFHSMTTLCGTTVLMFGGKDKSGKALNDTWIFESDTKTWKSPTVVSEFPVPALFRHVALAVHDPHSNCSCKQSVVILSHQSWMWSDLWQIRCIDDMSIYQWRKVEYECNTTWELSHSKYVTCPIGGKTGLSVSIVKESVVIAIAENGLWKYDYLQQTWTLLQTADSSGIAPFKKDVSDLATAVYIPQLKRYVIFGFEANITSYSLDTKEWESKSALGDNPMTSLAAVVDGNAIVAYGGTSTTSCHQYLYRLIRTGNSWVWIPHVTVSVQPNLAPQFVLGLSKSRLYVCGESVRLREMGYAKHLSVEMWKLNVTNMQWWKVSSPPEACQTVCRGSRGYYRSVRFQSNKFVIFGSGNFNMNPPLHIYWISNNTWQTQTTRLPPPQARQYHSMSSYNETAAFLFGGKSVRPQCSNCSLVLKDLWMLLNENETLEWMVIHNNSKTRNCPSARMQHVMVIIGTRIYVYGGYGALGQELNDFWQYDIIRNLWTIVETTNAGPVILSPRWSLLATTVGNQMIMTLGCFDKQSDSIQYDLCNITKPHGQETWFYSPVSKIWMRISSTHSLSDIFETHSGPSTPLMYNQGRLMLLNARNVLDRAKIHYMEFACPNGYYSYDITSELCRPCPTGKYSNPQRDNCQNCPNKLTTTSAGMDSIHQCSQCVKSYCKYGKCLVVIQNVSDISEPKCECIFGFTGDHCDFPTYYLIAVGLVILVTVVVLVVVCLVNAAKRKQIRERNLRSQIEELLSVWQIGHEELTLLDMIGLGAFGKVYKSEYRETVVAVKVLNVPEELDTDNEVAREIRFMQTIRHPNVVMFIGAGKRTDGCPFLVTEFVSRGSLRDVLDDESIELTLSRKLQFAIGAAKGLNFLHTLSPPRIHRDVKSANLLVSEKWVVKVADFGLGRQIAPQRRQHSNSSVSNRELDPLLGARNDFTHKVGTAKWRAPELSTTESYDTAVDVYRYDHNNNNFGKCMKMIARR